ERVLIGLMRNARGTLHVFTYKDGVLSAMAHDLRLTVEQFVVTLDDDTVRGEFDLRSLALDGPVENVVVRPERCDERMRAEVEQAAQRRILHTEQHPASRFVGRAVPSAQGFKVSGELALAGRTAPVSFDVRDDGGTYR